MSFVNGNGAELLGRIERSELEVNGLVVLRAGRTLVEHYREPYRAGVPQLLYSLSKSFTSIAVGIACDLGLLALDDLALSFFPDKRPAEVSSNLAAMQIRHLLSMTAGHDGDIYPSVTARTDWAAAFLAQPVEHVPGTFYRYSTPSTYMLSAIVERVSGRNLVDFLMPTLFEPLGIARPVWETCPLGVTAGGMGLSLSTADTAKFGQMLLGRGVYAGRRIVSEHYVGLAASEQSDNRAGACRDRIDSAQGYGFQFHRCRFGAYRGDGSFGQLCLVSPRHDLVVAANCGFPSMSGLQALLDLIFDWAGEKVGSADRELQLRRAAETDALGSTIYASLITPATAAESGLSGSPPLELPFSPETVYRLDPNPAGLRSAVFRLTENGFELTTDYGDERSGTLPFGFSRALEAEDVFVKDLSRHRQKVVTSVEAAGEDSRSLRLKLHYTETPYRVLYTIRRAECGILWSFAINVSFGYRSYEVLGREESGYRILTGK
ncbi:serine hydrolase [Saccharibacillus deserti]|uniref:serine hydrolase n=1 Tax=Saccharibacillus deserti TaxID=1634444 RepID=UPI001551A292